MGLPNFSIQLDSPTGAFYAGTQVTGRVVLSLDKPKKVRALNLKIIGEAKVSWDETRRETRTKADNTTEEVDENVSFVNDEVYFTNNFKLVGEQEIPSGNHTYPFSTTLPQMLPSTFDGEYGHVRYTITAVLDRPWKIDHEVKKTFNVVAAMDLNYNNLAKESAKVEEHKSFCCLCCKSGPLQLVVCVPQKGYVPGQSIPLTVEVDNASNVAVESVKAMLNKEITFTAQRPEYKVKNDIVKVSSIQVEGCPANGSKSWTNQVAIPSMPFVNLEACSIIKITHELEVEACVTGMHKNLHARVPIIIGSVPIYNGAPTPAVSAGDPAVLAIANQVETMLPSAPPPAYMDILSKAPIGFNVN